jgi:hypothetical protein
MKRTREEQDALFDKFFKESDSATSAYNLCETICNFLEIPTKNIEVDYFMPLNLMLKHLDKDGIEELNSYFEQYSAIIDGEIYKHYKNIAPVKNKLTKISITSNDGVKFEHNLDSVEEQHREQIKNMIEITTFYLVAFYVVDTMIPE